MTSYFFPTRGGIRATISGLDIGVWVEDIGLGPQLHVGYGSPNNADPASGWVSVAIIDGWQDEPTMAAAIAAAGGMGTYLQGKGPTIQGVLQTYFAAGPLPIETNATPATIDDMNNVLAEYFDILAPGIGQSAPQFVIDYNKPNPPPED